MAAFSVLLCERHPHLVDFVDPAEADEQAELLRANGLQTLNDKVLASPSTEVLDVIAEHNMGVTLVRRGFTDIQHEPPSMRRPVDFVGQLNGRGYRVEVKRLGSSKHDKLHSNVMQTLNTALESNDEPVAISLRIDEAFEKQDINALVEHVKQSLSSWREGKTYCFPVTQDWLALYTFRHYAKAEHARVIATDDADMRDVTGKDQARVRDKVKLAYDKFKVAPADDLIQLIALEIDNTVHLSSVSDALYGRDATTVEHSRVTRQFRNKDGAFCQGLHSRLGGIVVARRVVRHRLFVPYKFTLFPNPVASLPVDAVKQALGADEVLGPNDYP